MANDPDLDAVQPEPVSRIPTGIGGLDTIIGGGLLKSGVYILQGSPGAGKTILANHVGYSHAASGGTVVYVTMLAESHARLLQHMRAFEFFNASLVPERVLYVSAFNALRNEGLPGVVKLLQGEMRAHRVGILILDGLVMAASAATSEEELKLFVSDIQAHSTLSGCTTLLLTSDDADRPVSAEQTMVDGIILMREKAYGPRRERSLEVVKFRGSNSLRGNHAFTIGPRGITIYPRLESVSREALHPGAGGETGLSTGVPDLDAMFNIGGYPQGGVNCIIGPSASGKTTLALHFMAGSSPGEHGVFFSFYESPDLLVRIADRLRLGGSGTLKSPHVELLWQPFGENMLDEMAYRLLDHVRRTRARRVVIDGLGGFLINPAFVERGGSFLSALTMELRRLGATTVVTLEEQFRRNDPLEMATLSAIADSVVRIRMDERQVSRREVWISKCRTSLFDLRVRTMELGPGGLRLSDASTP